MKIRTFLSIGFATFAMLSCHRGPKPPLPQQNLPISMSKPAKGDKAIYGLACMGCTDSAVVMLPNQGGDPVKYNISKSTATTRYLAISKWATGSASSLPRKRIRQAWSSTSTN